MFPLWFRAVVTVLFTWHGINLVSVGDRSGFLFLAIGPLLVYGYFRYGTVWFAFRAARAGDYNKADRLISQIRYPAALASQSRAYYELLVGVIELNHPRELTAEQHLRTSLNFAFRTDNDRCLAEVTLAELLARKGMTAEVRELISQAKTRDCRPEIRERINSLSASL